ncbi:OmpW family protein [Acinetobacter sp. NIPH 1852]|uniref:OmpW family outer membrane protein n=1 Tax=Acinetobacter sp. NIPH 1852 TaxID=2923428 RepID=UPI001F4BAE6A|nr:OmpW family outer membrane protein [Acinetobacter sp. NIPH 1852]MCH7308619.1 OmpW family protein [Acinetobacter sp. NIPH 1852]
MKKSFACLITTGLCALPTLTFADSPYFSLKDGDGFKRFSVSAGWLHAMPQGKANNIFVNTSAKNGTYAVGDVQLNSVTDAIAKTPEGDKAKEKLLNVAALGKDIGLIENDTLTADMSGSAKITSLESWENQNTGLEAEDVDTIGLMINYNFTDNLSLEVKAGIPPKVDIKGKGQINAPLLGIATPEGNVGGILGRIANGLINDIGPIPLDSQIPITNLSKESKAASARAWLPAVELHYQFGKSGVNKFRPYVGAGVMYAYFNDLKMNSNIETDLINAGHMVQNVLDGKAGAALDGKKSSADPVVKLKATDTFAPIVTLGATYDFKPNWFAVGSVSYSKMNNEAKIYVTDRNTGKELIRANTKIDIDPLITYVGIGYRF